jgi:hypothetical protein
METTNGSTRASIHLWKCMGLSNAYFNIPIASIQKNKRTSYIFTNECFREYIQTECYRDSFLQNDTSSSSPRTFYITELKLTKRRKIKPWQLKGENKPVFCVTEWCIFYYSHVCKGYRVCLFIWFFYLILELFRHCGIHISETELYYAFETVEILKTEDLHSRFTVESQVFDILLLSIVIVWVSSLGDYPS